MRGGVDWFLIGVPGAASDRFDRRRVLVVGALASAAVSAGFTLHRFTLEPPGLGHANVATATLVMATAPFLMRAVGSYVAAAHTLLLGLSAGLFFDSWLYGGLNAPAPFVMMLVPLMAAFYLGRLSSVVYGLLQAVSLVGLFALGTQDLILLPDNEGQLPMMRLVGGMGVVAFAVAIAWVYDLERRGSLARVEAVVDHMADGLLAVDASARVVHANHRALELVGLKALPTDGSVAGLLDGALADLVLQTLRTGEVQRTDLRFGHADIQATASPIRLGDQTLDGAVLLLRDVTLEREVDRMKTDFISTVTHELRTPMTSVLGFAKLSIGQLESRVLPAVDMTDTRAAAAAPKVLGNIRIIVTEAERLTALINDVLDIAKMEAGHLQWRLEPVQGSVPARRALEATRSLFDGPVALAGDIDDDLPTLHGDADRLQQVLMNLVANAARFTEHGEVRLEARQAGDRVRYVVSDTGSGIPPDRLRVIFERFRQIHDAAGPTRGTGLGLAIAREIVAAHGGEIHAESVLGEGSRFVVELPIATDPEDSR